MSTIKDPVSFSEHFGIGRHVLEGAGAIDPILNVDLRLFIDPLLILNSRFPQMKVGATQRIRSHFEEIITLLSTSQREGDIAWRQARRKMTFHEVSATCLGYGAASTNGSGIGPQKTEKILRTSKEIVDAGVRDPDLFLLLPMLEEGIGPDLISDMITSIIQLDLAEFTQEILKGQSLAMVDFEISGRTIKLPKNPYSRSKPVLLVPRDIVDDLPVGIDREDVERIVAKNQEIRDRVNKYLAKIWQQKTLLRRKQELRAAVMTDPAAFTTLLDLVRSKPRNPYDFSKDPSGLLAWRSIIESIAKDYPFAIAPPAVLDAAAIHQIAISIIRQFSHLIEKRGLWKLLWDGDKHHDEKNAQMIFFAVADSYCKSNNIDITPEADSGTGPVDFKLSTGHTSRVLVEIKLSSNTRLVPGYEKQLEIYKEAEKTNYGIYLVLDVGSMGKKDEQLAKIKKARTDAGLSVSDIVYIDGSKRPYPSKA